MGDINANKLSGDECVGCSVQPPPPLSPPPPALESVEAETSDSELLGTVVGAGTGTGTEEEVGSTIGSESTEKGVSKSGGVSGTGVVDIGFGIPNNCS